MQQVCKVHKLNVNWVGLHWYSRSSRINKIQVDDYEKMAQLPQTDVVLLIEYDVLAILYQEINTSKCVFIFLWDIEIFVCH